MIAKANPTAVGVFVLTSLALAVTGLVVFSSIRLFSEKETFILYFEDSVSGLEVGAPVKFKGVKIGQVQEVLIRFNQKPSDLYTPVLVEIDHAQVQAKMDRSSCFEQESELNTLINRGLRGQLDTESLITGRLFVGLEVFPNTAPVELHQQNRIYKEIPTRSTRLAATLKALSQVDVRAISERLQSLLARLDDGVAQVDFKQINDSVVGTLKLVEQVVQSPEVPQAITALRQAAEGLHHLSTNTSAQIAPVRQDLSQTLAEAQRTLHETRTAIAEIRSLLAPRSPLRQETESALAEVSDAARALTLLTEFLTRNPQALLSGRKRSESKP